MQRLLALFGVALATALSLLAWTPTTARAAAGDQIEQFRASFEVQKSGIVHVTESFAYRFGASSGRHGPTISVVTRERLDNDHDQTYEYRNLVVSSPDAPTKVDRSTSARQGGRLGVQTWRIGDPDHTVSSPTAHYTISYDLVGALRHFASYDEFYWDVLSDNTAYVTDAEVTLTVPGGVQAVTCSMGRLNATGGCKRAAVTDGKAVYTATGKTSDDFLTISGKIAPGQVLNPNPVLVEPGDRVAHRVARNALLATPIAAAVPFLLGWFLIRRNGDDRFAGLPPGVLPAEGAEGQVVRSGRVEIPVAFAPPQLPLADASLLLHGAVGRDETAATIVQLATQGALTMGGVKGKPWVQLVDPTQVVNDQQKVVLDELFGGAGDRLDLGQQAERHQVELGTAGQIYEASLQLAKSSTDDAHRGGWFHDMSHGSRHRNLFHGLLLLTAVAAVVVFARSSDDVSIAPAMSALVTLVVVFGLALLAASWWVGQRTSVGRRSATGRALTDQVEGFRTYIATAEAEQLRFEEGEDIYSRYLPWAIIFGLADRWAKVCARLVELGRLSAQPPSWYAGDPVFWNYYWFNSQVSDVSTSAAPEPSSSGTGSGGGSSFSGGGFSGGGGGGMSIGSW